LVILLILFTFLQFFVPVYYLSYHFLTGQIVWVRNLLSTIKMLFIYFIYLFYLFHFIYLFYFLSTLLLTPFPKMCVMFFRLIFVLICCLPSLFFSEMAWIVLGTDIFHIFLCFFFLSFFPTFFYLFSYFYVSFLFCLKLFKWGECFIFSFLFNLKRLRRGGGVVHHDRDPYTSSSLQFEN
jgi:hypothetical protein